MKSHLESAAGLAQHEQFLALQSHLHQLEPPILARMAESRASSDTHMPLLSSDVPLTDCTVARVCILLLDLVARSR